MTASPPPLPRPHLFVCLYLSSELLSQTIRQSLGVDRYLVAAPESDEAFFNLIEHQKQQLDCLILDDTANLPHLANWLHGKATLLPLLILEREAGDRALDNLPEPAFLYHMGEVRISANQTEQLTQGIERAISEFLNLSPACRLPGSRALDLTTDLSAQNFLLLQQRRLTEKLKERLGYLGIYYKRNPKNFFRNSSKKEQQEFLTQLRLDYRAIILNYFSEGTALNQRIDDFVNTAFFADISVAQIVEVHMELMDEFSKQLKLEGRSEEILLDYRLTLIDTIAHLCEMYRRSIPRES
ncbi:circadian clock protein KaiA [Phormidesmis sp. 146-35]